MSAPKRLPQLAGAPSAPSSLAAATVVMIDCQREYVDGVLALPDGRGGVLTADAPHRASLVALSDRFAVIAPDVAAIPAE